ncbi:hypothetical protein B0H14DRAFT_3505052 [Mycena olivaceomarginata]|nr:hypothetical protein B0H14DRAFT_3505052 [Mycena olivaceomarginata]
MSQSHKKAKRKVPQLVVSETVATASHTSADGRRVRIRTGLVLDGSGPSSITQESFWADDLATNLARESDSFSKSTNTWRKTFGAKGAAPPRHMHIAPDLAAPIADAPVANVRNPRNGAAWTRDAWHPTHFVQKWNGTHFVRKRTWLQELGLRVQLGHPPGIVCPYREAAAHDFVLYDLSGVHELNVDFCGCRIGDDPPTERRIQLLRACWWPATITAPNTCATFRTLRLFQTLNCLGKLTAYDFLRGLEKCTNHDGLDKPPDRRKPFMHIMRQWREVKRHKHAKCGHFADGVRGTKQGELALACRACPQVGWNLPEGWEKAPPAFKFIYFLFLAQDANFRLNNRSVSSEAVDPILGDGWGYFVKQEEISNCSGFKAMFQANAKRTKGLRTTGVGGVTCSRHNMWRANGLGDLQCNIDFILLATLIAFQLLWLIVSYDIACQYAINFWTRMSGLPERMRLTIPPANVWWKVPNFHLPDHHTRCHPPFSFHWMPGAGKSHGETIEQNWAFSNGAARSTRLMGPGSRQATLEDVFGFHNYDRLLAMHRVFPKRLAVAMIDGAAHKIMLEAFTKGLEEANPAQVKEWRSLVEAWESKQHSTGEKSPFEAHAEVTTLRDIQLAIAKEELMRTETGDEVERDHSAGTFISMGLEIEEAQRKLTVDVRVLKDPTATQMLAFTKRRIALLKRIHKFRQIQNMYMPALRSVLSASQKQMYDGEGEQAAEATRLFMPSEIKDGHLRRRVCMVGVPDIEARMREGEASEALEDVRGGLRTRTMANRYKLRNYTGQGLLTRGQNILRVISLRIHSAKIRYQYARAALLALRGHGQWEERLHVLADDDVRGLNERTLTAEEKAQNERWAEIGGAIIEGGVARAAGVAAGEGSHSLSWIWYSVGTAAAPESPNDVRFEESLRVEWCKALARSSRYDEEVRLLRKEMRRTIAYGEVAAREWERLLAEELPGASPELTEGRRAYAAEHAATEHARCANLEIRWRGILAKADVYLNGDVAAAGTESVTVEVHLEDELDPEEEEARLEGEEED